MLTRQQAAVRRFAPNLGEAVDAQEIAGLAADVNETHRGLREVGALDLPALVENFGQERPEGLRDDAHIGDAQELAAAAFALHTVFTIDKKKSPRETRGDF